MLSLIRLSLIGLLAVSLPVQQDREGGQFTIGVDVDLVVFNLSVTGSGGREISGLKASDFQVYEDGRLQTIKLFRAEDVPATVGLIIDTSGSMREKQPEVMRAAVQFVDASNPSDEMFVMNFNEKVYSGLPPSTPFTNDAALIRSALLKTPAVGLTALYDALAAGIEHLKVGTRERKALVLLSDGGDNASHRKLDDVLQIAQRSSATIFTIGIYDEADSDQNPGVLKKIANQSGGRAYFPGSLKDLGAVWHDIAGRIRSQYTIGYSSTNPARDGSFRRVKISARQNGGGSLRVITRPGYLAAGDKAVAR